MQIDPDLQLNKTGQNILQKGKVLQKNETPNQMIERMTESLSEIEKEFTGKKQYFKNQLINKLNQKKIVFSTTVMTNAGSQKNKPLSACTVPPISLKDDWNKIKQTTDKLHQEGMGTGFNFNNLEDPLSMLNFLNEVAIQGVKSGKEDRPVGNMGILDVDHPKIKEFIKTKLKYPGEWKFNISININHDFIKAYKNNTYYTLKDGKKVKAKYIIQLIAKSSLQTGDPGLIFLDKMNEDNPTPTVGKYESTAPCAEVGLTQGESCQFGYLNLASFFDNQGNLDKNDLQETTKLLTRALDNALEVNIKLFQNQENIRVTQAKRKIGVGVCGLADMLAKLNLPYNSPKGRQKAQDIIALINYYSKQESVTLSKERGSFTAFPESLYISKPSLIKRKYNLDTLYVKKQDWLKLDKDIQTQGLRNASTVALPPTGRSGAIIGVSTGIEPFFSLSQNGEIYPQLKQKLQELKVKDEIYEQIRNTGWCEGLKLDNNLLNIYQTATQLKSEDQLKMVACLQKVIDEAISKTINLPQDTQEEDFEKIFLYSYQAGLKGMTIYRNKSRDNQPLRLTDKEK